VPFTPPPASGWRTTYPELAGHVDRLPAALPHVHAALSSWEYRWLTGMSGAVANLAEETAGLRPAKLTAPIPPRFQEQKQTEREYATLWTRTASWWSAFHA
jgi:hypothetical protein